MPLLCLNSFIHTPLSSSSSSSSILAIATARVSRVHLKPIDLPPKCLSGGRISKSFIVQKTCSVGVRVAAAASDDGVGATSPDEGGSPPESKNEVVPVNKLPLESKLKERGEQRLRMKMAKKIRLRRKRLVRKRRLRKKGRWPPSKMKKLKNV